MEKVKKKIILANLAKYQDAMNVDSVALVHHWLAMLDLNCQSN